jgi:hypothetical protein
MDKKPSWKGKPHRTPPSHPSKPQGPAQPGSATPRPERERHVGSSGGLRFRRPAGTVEGQSAVAT